MTVSENTATEAGGLWNEDGGSFELLNTIVAENTGTNADVSGEFSASHSFVGTVGSATGFGDASNITGTNADPADPLLGSLTDNGGFTRSYRPAANSPVIDAGLSLIHI